MAVSYGTYTITNIQEGSQIWTTSVAPTTPNYTFNISNLTGDSETSIKVGDIIMYDFYRYTVSNVNSDGTTVLTGDRTSIRGATGASATTYHLILSTLAIVKGSTGGLSPSSIVLTAKSQSGSNAMANYSGRFKIETTTNNSTWSTKYTSSGNEATKTYTLPTDIAAVRCSLYLAGGTTTLLDQQTVPVVTNGIEITSTSVTYQSGTSGTTKPTGTWQTSIPSVAQGNYLWTKTVVNYSDGTSTESYSVARQGNNGTNGTNGTSPTVSSTTVQYQQSTNGSTTPTGSWNNNPPTAVAGQYMWTKTTITYSDGASAVSYSVSKNGTNGTNGNSISITSTSVTYQAGTSGTTKPTGNWQTSIPSVSQGGYLWTKTVVNYSDGSSTESYSTARQGSNGTNGTNGTSPTVSSTVVEYQQATDGKNVPTGTWSTTPPTAVAGQYIWTRTTITYSDNATAVSYSVGKNGINGNSITITSTSVTYQKGTSGTTKPTGSWGTSIPSVGEGEYLWTKTVVSYSDGKSTESYSVSRNATNGINGISPTISSTVTEYAQSTDGVNKPTSGWNTTPPTAIPEQYIWSRVTVTYSDNATAVSYSVSRNGTDGEDAYTVSLSNDNHTFAGDTTKAIPASVDCSVIGFKGATQVAVTIGTISGEPTGMTTSKTNNGTTNAYFTVSVTASMTTRNGVLTIPVTIDGKSFTKKFTYSLALKGDKGDKGDKGGTWYSGTAITGTNTTATIFSNSGISSAVVGDMYLNTTTYNTYRCTVGGNASTAKWVYVNNIKGIGISSIKNQYYLHTSSTTAPASTVTWLDAPPAYEKNHYYWTRSYITWSGGNNPTTTTPVFDNALTDANKNAEEAKLVANNYLSSDLTGIMIADLSNGNQTPSQATGRNVFINNTSVNIRNGQSKLAVFGADGICIGNENKGHTVIDNSKMTIYAGTGSNDMVEVGVLGAINNPTTGLATITETLDFTNMQASNYEGCYATYPINSVLSVTVNGGESIDWVFPPQGGDASHWIEFPNITSEQAEAYGVCTVTYTTFSTHSSVRFGNGATATGADSLASGNGSQATNTGSVALGILTKAFGVCSLALGEEVEASGDNSFASGYRTKALEDYSHAEGVRTVASGRYSYAIGNHTQADGFASYAGGLGCDVSGRLSFAYGQSLLASGDNQFVIGKYNGEDATGNIIFIIGNGDGNARSNAFSVDRNGNVVVSGALATSNTITQNGTAVSLNGHQHSASSITSGTLSIERGGSGSSGVTSITTIADIATAGSGYSVTQAQFCSWGKVATVHLAVKKNSSAGSGTQTICTLKSGYRPKFASPGNYGYASNCVIATDGAITISGSVAANATLQIYATYVLA